MRVGGLFLGINGASCEQNHNQVDPKADRLPMGHHDLGYLPGLDATPP
jgi:hypothetical protein